MTLYLPVYIVIMFRIESLIVGARIPQHCKHSRIEDQLAGVETKQILALLAIVAKPVNRLH